MFPIIFSPGGIAARWYAIDAVAEPEQVLLSPLDRLERESAGRGIVALEVLRCQNDGMSVKDE